jgi:hypothetical protein
MERGSKKQKLKRKTILNLGKWIPQKDVIRLILSHLNHVDWQLVWAAHNKKIENRLVRSTNFLKHCIGKGYLEVLKWLRQNGCELNIHAYKYAAKKGHLDIIKYLMQHKYKWDHWIGTYAVSNGHLNVLMWLKEINYSFRVPGKSIILILGLNEHIDALRWALKNYLCTSYHCVSMAYYGKLKALQCMIESGCPYNLQALLGVAHDISVVEWLVTLR